MLNRRGAERGDVLAVRIERITSTRVLTTPPVVADGKVFAKDAQSTVSAYDAETGKVVKSDLKPHRAD